MEPCTTEADGRAILPRFPLDIADEVLLTRIVITSRVELARLARLSHPRVTVNTAGLTPEKTALANRLAQNIHRLTPETVAALHAVLDSTTRAEKPRLRRAAGQGTR